MKNLLFFIALLFSSHVLLQAQAFNLPVSTTSEKAKRAYEAATYLGSNLRFDAARMEIDQALALDPNFFMAYVYQYQVLASPEEKAALVDKILNLNPKKFTEAEKIMRGQMQVWRKDPEAFPTKTMQALVAAYPTTPEAYEWASLHAAFTEKNPAAAMAYAEKLVALDSNFPPVYNTLGYLYLSQEQMDKAQQAFETYLELAPAEPNAHDSMGEYYMITKDYTKSAAYYDQAAALGMESSAERAEKARAMMLQPQSVSDEYEMQVFARNFMAAYNRQDHKAIQKMYLDDAVRIDTQGKETKGAANIGTYFEEQFRLNNATLLLKQMNLNWSDREHAWISSGTYQVYGITNVYDIKIDIAGKYANTMAKVNGEWKIAQTVLTPIVKVVVYHEVKDFAQWKSAFNEGLPELNAAGGRNCEIGTLQGDPNTAYVISEWPSVEAFQAFFLDPELNASRDEAGVVGKPTVLILDRQ